MSAIETLLDFLAQPDAWCYHRGQEIASEPAALAALALVGHGRLAAALKPLDWLVAHQQGTGQVALSASQQDPGWTTAWALLAWRAHDAAAALPVRRPRASQGRYIDAIELGCRYMLSISGLPLPRSPEMGHNTELIGWPWVIGTHSWLEPTCHAVLALTACGRADHPRVQEGVRLLYDRLLPDGGANYGNTIVLGQKLLAHLQPTGLVLLTLPPVTAAVRVPAREVTSGKPPQPSLPRVQAVSEASASNGDQRLHRSADFLLQHLKMDLPLASVAYACLGLAAQRRMTAALAQQLRERVDRELQTQPQTSTGFQPALSLAALALLEERCPLITLPAEGRYVE